jgi:hypothetical protein
MKQSPKRWPRVIIALCGAILLLGVSGAAASFTAIERGLVAGPDLRLALGPYHLIARATDRPECLPLTIHECFVSFPTASVSAPRYYAVWFGHVSTLPAAGTEARVTVSKGWHLLQLRLRS